MRPAMTALSAHHETLYTCNWEFMTKKQFSVQPF